jgi:hypothetical protein
MAGPGWWLGEEVMSENHEKFEHESAVSLPSSVMEEVRAPSNEPGVSIDSRIPGWL